MGEAGTELCTRGAAGWGGVPVGVMVLEVTWLPLGVTSWLSKPCAHKHTSSHESGRDQLALAKALRARARQCTHPLLHTQIRNH